MNKRDPEGYRKLMAYQKACELQIFTNNFVANLPKTKTFFDLADQMARSGRSGSKNIVEGWKRNTTKEYFDFLGFSIGAIEELKDDAADIITGVYPNLMGLKGKMGVMGEKGRTGGDRGMKGFIETESEESLKDVHGSLYSHSSSPYTLLVPLCPLDRKELDKIKFYPLDTTLVPIIKLFLKAKETNFLLYKLQKSLDLKMDNEKTKPAAQRYKAFFDQDKEADKEFMKYMHSLGLKRLENGQFVQDADRDPML